MKKALCCIIIAALLMTTAPVTLRAAEKDASVGLRNMKSYTLTEKQFEFLKVQPGMTYYSELPAKLPAKHIAVVVPKEFGGGFLVGTAEDIASAFNAAGITVGLRASSVSGLTSGIVGGAASTILGIIMAFATGTSKPLISQVYDRSTMKDGGNEAEGGKLKKTVFKPEDEGSKQTVTDHHAADHHVEIILPEGQTEVKDTEAGNIKKLVFKPGDDGSKQTVTDHHAADHHVEIILPPELNEGQPEVKDTEGGNIKKLIFKPGDDGSKQTVTDHHAADHHILQ